MRFLKAFVVAICIALLPGVAWAAAPADLKITMTASPNPVALNGRVTFHIVITNLGPGIARGVKLWTLDGSSGGGYAGPTWISQGHCTDTAGGERTCPIGEIDPGRSVYATIVIAVGSGGGDAGALEAKVYSFSRDPNTKNNTASMNVRVVYGSPTPSGSPSVSGSPSGSPTASPSGTVSPSASPTASGTGIPTSSAGGTGNDVWPWTLLAIAVALCLAGGGYLVWRRRHAA